MLHCRSSSVFCGFIWCTDQNGRVCQARVSKSSKSNHRSFNPVHDFLPSLTTGPVFSFILSYQGIRHFFSTTSLCSLKNHLLVLGCSTHHSRLYPFAMHRPRRTRSSSLLQGWTRGSLWIGAGAGLVSSRRCSTTSSPVTVRTVSSVVLLVG